MNLYVRTVTGGLATTLVAGSLVGASLLGAPAQAQPAHQASSHAARGASTAGSTHPTSLATVLAADGHRFDHNWSDFDILDKAIRTVLRKHPDSAVGVLGKARVRLTAFLPTDRAFRRLAKDLTGKAPATERATFKVLVHAAGVKGIESVLLYHVVPGRTLTAKKVVAADGTKLTTAQGGKITVRVRDGRVHLADADPKLPNPRVIATNINRGNPQIAHAINRVLLPVRL